MRTLRIAMRARRRVAYALVLASGLFGAHCSLVVDTSGLTGGATIDSGVEEAGSGDATLVDATQDAPADAVVEIDGPDEPVASRYAMAVLADNPAIYYHLDETAGATAGDAMGTHPGTYFGSVQLGQPGIFAGSTAVSFTGTSAGIDAGALGVFRARTPFTIELWAKPLGYDGEYRFLARRLFFDADGGRNDLGVNAQDQGGLVFERFIASAGRGARTGLPPIDGFFHHLVCVYDGNGLVMYRDGVVIADEPDARSAPDADGTFYIGTGETGRFTSNAVIDEVAVYGKALDVTRVIAHFEIARGK